MTGEPGRLLRLGRAFEAQAKALKLQLLHLEQLRKSREDDLVGLHQALAMPIVTALPLFTPVLRRINQLKSQIAQLDHDITAVRGRLIEAHARSELSVEIAQTRIAVRTATREAGNLLEMTTGFGQSSLRQDGSD